MSKKFSFRFKNPLGLRKKDSTGKPKKWRWNWKTFWKIALTAGSILALVLIFLFAYYSKDLPTPGKIRNHQSAQATQILDRNGNPLYTIYDNQNRISVTSDQIPDNAKHATIAIEDQNFYTNIGIDFRGMARALLNDIQYVLHIGHPYYLQGASTITQEYVRNALLTQNRTVDRKIKEIILTLEINFMYSKDQILTMFLNEIPYGSNAYGIESASKTFFNKDAKDLTLTESATLAALPQRPSRLSPYGNHLDELKTRRDYVLDRMQKLGYISEDEMKTAQATPMTFAAQHTDIVAPHFVFYVRDLLIQEYGDEEVLQGGLKVTTTLDPDAQKAAQQSIDDVKPKLAGYGADNAAITAVDPNNGQILAMVGSVDYFDTEHDGNFNVATHSRQPGSSFKPIVYASAFEGQFNPSSTLWDVNTDFNGYNPQDFDGKNRGPVTIRSALDNSLNIPAVKMLSLVGIDKAAATAKDMGISTLTSPDQYGLAMVLGGAEVKPLEMASAYGVFAKGGEYHPTSAILKVEDGQGRVLEEWKDQSKRVLPPEVAYEMNNVLSDNAARTPVFGAHSPLFFADRPVAAKTGTTQNFQDGWTIGYTPSVSSAVWVGRNDNKPMRKNEDGVVVAAPIFHEFMSTYLKGKVVEQFTRPNTIQDITVDSLSNKLPGDGTTQTITDIFAPWQVPKDKDNIHVTVNVNKDNGKLATDQTPPDLVEKRTYTVIHSERPTTPAWENPVIEWAKSHGYNLDNPPTDKDTIDNSQLPSVSVVSPKDNAGLTAGPITIVAGVYAPRGVRKVSFSVDNNSVGDVTSDPWSVTFDGSSLSQGNHEIEITLTDNLGSTAKITSLFVIAQDGTPPGDATNISASPLGASGQVKLSWTSPSDSDLGKVIIYQSTTSSVLGTAIRTINEPPGHADSINVTGLTPGTPYYFTIHGVDKLGNENQSTKQTSTIAP